MSEFAKDNKESKELLARLKDLPNEDFKALKDKYSLDSDGLFNVAEALLGGDIVANVKKARKYYAEYSPYLEKFKEAKTAIKGEPLPKPARGVGRTVKFVEYHPTPKWHLKKLDLDVTTQEKDQIVGRLTNASSAQKVVKKPMEFVAKSVKSVGYESLEFVWIHDRLEKDADLITLDLMGADKDGVKSNGLYMDSSKLDTNLDLIIKDGELLGGGKLLFKDTKLGVESPKGDIEKIVDRTLGAVSSFVVDIGLKGKPFAPKISLKTDLDNQLKKQFKSEIEKAKKEFEAKLKDELSKNAKNILANAGASAKDIEMVEKLLAKNANALDILGEKTGKNLSQKALEDELKNSAKNEAKEKQKEIESKAKDSAKSLLKKIK